MAIKQIKSKHASTPSKSPSKGTAVTAKSETTQAVVANARLVDALRNYQASKEQTKSYLIDVATIVQEEQLTKEEVIASMMEARGIERKTAGEQYSRMRKILLNPKIMEQLKTGDIDYKVAREQTKTARQKSTKQVQENAEKVIVRSISAIINKAKESGQDLKSIIEAIKAAAKKAGLL